MLKRSVDGLPDCVVVVVTFARVVETTCTVDELDTGVTSPAL